MISPSFRNACSTACRSLSCTIPTITFTRAITAITWTSGSGASYAGATMPTTIAVGALVRLWWVQSLSSWMHMVPV